MLIFLSRNEHGEKEAQQAQSAQSQIAKTPGDEAKGGGQPEGKISEIDGIHRTDEDLEECGEYDTVV